MGGCRSAMARTRLDAIRQRARPFPMPVVGPAPQENGNGEQKLAEEKRGPISFSIASPPQHALRHGKTLWLDRACCGGITLNSKPAKSCATKSCLLYTSDAADERSSVDLGGRRIIKK